MEALLLITLLSLHSSGPCCIKLTINGNYHGNTTGQPIKFKVSIEVAIDRKVTINGFQEGVQGVEVTSCLHYPECTGSLKGPSNRDATHITQFVYSGPCVGGVGPCMVGVGCVKYPVEICCGYQILCYREKKRKLS